MHFDRSDLTLLGKSLSPIRLFKRLFVWAVDFYSTGDGKLILFINGIGALVVVGLLCFDKGSPLFLLLTPIVYFAAVIGVTFVIWILVKFLMVIQKLAFKWNQLLLFTGKRWKQELESERYKNYKPKPKNDD